MAQDLTFLVIDVPLEYGIAERLELISLALLAKPTLDKWIIIIIAITIIHLNLAQILRLISTFKL